MDIHSTVTVVDANSRSVTGTVVAIRDYLAGIKAGIRIVYIRNADTGDEYRMIVWPGGIINRITKTS